MRIMVAILLVILLVLQYRLWVGEGSFAQIVRLERQIEKQKVINRELETRNRKLLEEVQELRSGYDGIEERARNELGMIKKDETFYLVVDEKPDDTK